MEPVYHERIKFPLFHVYYNVFVSTSIDAMMEHVEKLFPGVDLKIPGTVAGYTASLRHPAQGSQLVMLINVTESEEWPPLLRRVIHECTHICWYMLEGLDIRIDEENHEIQAYMMEELVYQVNKVINNYKESPNNSLNDL